MLRINQRLRNWQLSLKSKLFFELAENLYWSSVIYLHIQLGKFHLSWASHLENEINNDNRQLPHEIFGKSK